MRSRLTVALSVLFVAVGTGGALAVQSSAPATPAVSSSTAQYKPPCPDQWNWSGKVCEPGHGHHWGWFHGWGWFWDAIHHFYTWIFGWSWVFI
jgi:hypothetical protein